MMRVVACLVPLMMCPASLGADGQEPQARDTLLELQSLQQRTHLRLEGMRVGLEPAREAVVQRELSEYLPKLQARALDLRKAALKKGLSVPPPSWGTMPANPRAGRLIDMTEASVDYAIMVASLLQHQIEDPTFRPMTSDIIAILMKIEVASSRAAASDKPDLIVCLRWDADMPLIYEDKQIHVQVKNVGQDRAPASTLRVYVKQNGAHYVEVPAMAPNRTFGWTGKFHWGTCGTKVVKAWADYHGQVAESNESNNEIESNALVSCAGFVPQVASATDVCTKH